MPRLVFFVRAYWQHTGQYAASMRFGLPEVAGALGTQPLPCLKAARCGASKFLSPIGRLAPSWHPAQNLLVQRTKWRTVADIIDHSKPISNASLQGSLNDG